MNGFLAEYNSLAQDAFAKQSGSLSYRKCTDLTPAEWQFKAREKLTELLAFSPEELSLNAEENRICVQDGVETLLVSYDMPYGPRTQAYLLRPTGYTGRLPAVLALHDHGAFKYFGKEKLVELPGQPAILRRFKEHFYDGKSWATQLAKQGYMVLVSDLFPWGSRKMSPELLPPELVQPLEGLAPGSEEYIEAYNSIAADYESVIAKTMVLAGTTWAGVMLYEDRRSLDYLCTRPDVDTSRIACGGLSGGGLRSIFLCGMDDRIRCGFTAGFMSVFGSILQHNVASHTWMLYLPGLSRCLDLPDIVAAGGKPFLALYNQDDELWEADGQREADETLETLYRALGIPEDYTGRFYPGRHKLDIAMQRDIYTWLGSML